jgi:hypothetical protein
MDGKIQKELSSILSLPDFMQQIHSREVFSSSESSPIRMQSFFFWGGGDSLHVLFVFLALQPIVVVFSQPGSGL